MSYYNWTEILSKKETSELAEIIRNKNSETEEKVKAALSELKNRGIESENYNEIVETNNKTVQEPDENSPILYSEKVIWTFSILFSVIFGGILFAINLKEVDKKKGIIPVIVFSIIYMALTIYVLDLIKAGTGGTLIAGAIGALILNELFWKKYIGKGIVYRRKSFVKPLIIALIIFVPLTILVIWANVVSSSL